MVWDEWMARSALAAAVFVLIVTVLLVLRRLLGRHATAEAEPETPVELFGAVWGRLNSLLVLLLALAAAGLVLEPTVRVADWLLTVIIAAVALQVAIWGDLLLTWSTRRRLARVGDGERAGPLRALAFIGRVAIYALALLLILDNIPGVEVTALLAGLGIGGIAVALAVQNILSDLFASLSITLDCPFAEGDFIVVGEFMGTVENVGLKTTRLRSLSGEQLIFANDDLLRSRIRNYKRMTERRALFTIGVLYQTPFEKVQAIPGMIREIVEAQEGVRFDRCHFKSYGDYALLFETVYFVLSSDYYQYMDRQQAINLAIFQRFEQEGIGFAYPTQTLYLAQPPEPA